MNKTVKTKISPTCVIYYRKCVALIASFGYCDLSHALWCKKSLQGPYTSQTESILENASKTRYLRKISFSDAHCWASLLDYSSSAWYNLK